jgi:hypothetical protein
MIPDRLVSPADESSVEGVCIVIIYRTKTIGWRCRTVGGSPVHLSVLEVVQENMETLALDTVLLHNNTAAANDFAGIALTIDLAQTGPGAQHLGVTNLDEVDLVLGAEGFDELDVLGLCAGLDKDAKMSLALVQGLGALAQTAGETVVNESVFQNLLEWVGSFRSPE